MARVLALRVYAVVFWLFQAVVYFSEAENKIYFIIYMIFKSWGRQYRRKNKVLQFCARGKANARAERSETNMLAAWKDLWNYPIQYLYRMF